MATNQKMAFIGNRVSVKISQNYVSINIAS